MSFSEWRKAIQPRHCPKCKGTNINVRTWTPLNEEYDDDQFKCQDCESIWWVDGADY